MVSDYDIIGCEIVGTAFLLRQSKREVVTMSTYETLSLMIAFGSLIVLIITASKK